MDGSEHGKKSEAGYQKLEIYQISHSLAVRIHKMSLSLPHFEMYETGSQIRRSAKSVFSNIVEGYISRKYKNEFVRYLYRAYVSGEETVEHLNILFETGSMQDKGLYDDLLDLYSKLNAKLFRFIQSVEEKHETPLYVKESHVEYQP